jgi:hypothetical protein
MFGSSRSAARAAARRDEPPARRSVPEILNVGTGAGRPYPRERRLSGRRVCTIGETIKEQLFGDQNPVGQIVRIARSEFRVIGVMERKGQSLGMDMDDIVFMPVRAYQKVFDQSGLFGIRAKARSHEEMSQAMAQSSEILKRRHHGSVDFTLISQDAMMSTMGTILDMMTYIMAGIAAISLIVGGIGIMNILLDSVAERTREVGLRMAVGAQRTDVLKQFLTESVLLSLLGGSRSAVGAGGASSVARPPPSRGDRGTIAGAIFSGAVGPPSESTRRGRRGPDPTHCGARTPRPAPGSNLPPSGAHPPRQSRPSSPAFRFSRHSRRRACGPPRLEVRRDDDVVELEERVIARQGSAADVDRRAATRQLQCYERTRSTTPPRGALTRSRRAASAASSLRRSGSASPARTLSHQSDAEQVRERDASRRAAPGLQVATAIVVDDPHVEAASAPRDFPADPAHPDDAERAFVDVGAEKQARVEMRECGGASEAVARDHVARGGEEDRHRQVGRGAVHCPRRVADGDAALRGGREVDVVDADSEVAHDLQAREEVEERSVDARMAVREERSDPRARTARRARGLFPRRRLADRRQELGDPPGEGTSMRTSGFSIGARRITRRRWKAPQPRRWARGPP